MGLEIKILGEKQKMININIVKKPALGTETNVIRQVGSHSKIKMTPEVVETLTSAGIQIVSILVMGLASIILKQSLFPAN
jgi:uncharacterized radical SAM superfamily protein